MNIDEDDPLVFPWEEAAAPPAAARCQQVSNPAAPGRGQARKTRRSSILKQPSQESGPDRAALQVRPFDNLNLVFPSLKAFKKSFKVF